MVRSGGWWRVAVLAGLAWLAACAEHDRVGATRTGQGPEADPGAARPVPQPVASPKPLAVAATTEVGAWLARSVGETEVQVVGALPPEAEPSRWQPDAAAVERLLGFDLLILNGAGLEHFESVVSLAGSRTLDLARAHRSAWLYLPTVLRHSHGPGGEHVHQGVDPHLALDPALLGAQATAVHRWLVARRPQARSALDRGLARTLAVIARWQAALESATVALAGAGLLADHPGHAYLARSQGWDVRLVDLAGAEAVATEAAAWQAGPGLRVAQALAEGPAQVMLTIKAPAPALAARLRSAHGLRVVVLPTGLGPPSSVATPPDPVQAWIEAAAALVEALEAARGEPLGAIEGGP